MIGEWTPRRVRVRGACDGRAARPPRGGFRRRGHPPVAAPTASARSLTGAARRRRPHRIRAAVSGSAGPSSHPPRRSAGHPGGPGGGAVAAGGPPRRAGAHPIQPPPSMAVLRRGRRSPRTRSRHRARGIHRVAAKRHPRGDRVRRGGDRHDGPGDDAAGPHRQARLPRSAAGRLRVAARHRLRPVLRGRPCRRGPHGRCAAVVRRTQTPAGSPPGGVRSAPARLGPRPGMQPVVRQGAVRAAAVRPVGPVRGPAADPGSRPDRPNSARSAVPWPSARRGVRAVGAAAPWRPAAGPSRDSAWHRAIRPGRPRDLFLPTCAVRGKAGGRGTGRMDAGRHAADRPRGRIPETPGAVCLRPAVTAGPASGSCCRCRRRRTAAGTGWPGCAASDRRGSRRRSPTRSRPKGRS